MAPVRWLVLALVAAVTLLGIACTPRAIDATRLGLDLAASARFNAAAVAARQPVRYAVEGRNIEADLYRPRRREPEGALVLVAGADRVGKDHPQFIAFASALANAGFAVLVPDLVNLRSLRIRRGDEVLVADAVQWLAEQEGRKVALVGVSYALGPAMLAAIEPRVSERVSFVLGIGGFYDLGRVVAGFRNPYGKWLFAAANSDAIDDPVDRTTIAAISARKTADLDADVADLFNELGPQGRAVYALLDAVDPSRADDLVAALPPKLRDEINGLTLKGRDLSGLKAPLLLVHGADDPLIAPQESKALAAAMGDRAHLYLIDRMRHVELGGDLDDMLKLWWVCWRVVGLR
jgi:dienelactone hydrolase